MTHVMLDIETFGTKPGCVIRSIGAMTFDPETNEMNRIAFKVNLQEDFQLKVGLTKDPETVKWWSEQNKEAQDKFIGGIDIITGLIQFTNWFNKNNCVELWAHGANFDPPILEAAYTAIGQKVPWEYSKVRDTRTFYFAKDFYAKAVIREGVYHDAIDDCMHQIKCVHQANGIFY